MCRDVVFVTFPQAYLPAIWSLFSWAISGCYRISKMANDNTSLPSPRRICLENSGLTCVRETWRSHRLLSSGCYKRHSPPTDLYRVFWINLSKWQCDRLRQGLYQFEPLGLRRLGDIEKKLVKRLIWYHITEGLSIPLDNELTIAVA